MRQYNFVVFTLAAIALITISGCSSNPSTPSASSTDTVTDTVSSNTQGSIKAGSSSSTVNFLQTLEKAYTSNTKTSKIALLEPGQSENIITGIKQGLVDVGAISKALKPEENDGTLESREAAKDALLVATHRSVVGVTNLTTENLRAIYSGKTTNWKQLGGPDAAIVVLDRPEDESAKRLLRKHYLGKELQNAPNAVVLRKEGELIQTLQSTPYSIGAFSLAHAISHNLPVNHLRLNGIEPTPTTLKAGQYPMARTISIVWSKQASKSTQAFVSYIFSQPGADVLEQAGFAPSTSVADASRQ